jgi:6-phosphogluconate dehydrogenase
MELGVIGLGRMGGNIVRRLQRAGHATVGYARRPEAVAALTDSGMRGVGSLADLVEALAAPRAIWLMVPAAAVESTLAELVPLLAPGDTVIDGGNSSHRDDIARSSRLAERGIDYVDVGTSGGVFGLERGFSLMIGGDAAAVRRLDPIFAALAEVWRRGSVVASWLLDLTASALARSPALDGFTGRVSDSGEGRWTIAAAIDEGVPAPVLTAALYARFSSRGEADFADRMLSAMRREFGGHVERTEIPAA